MHVEADFTKAAEELIQQGITTSPVDHDQVTQTRAAFDDLMALRIEQGDSDAWSFTSPRAETPDLGLIKRGGGKKDLKTFVHVNEMLQFLLGRNGLILHEAERVFLRSSCALLQSVHHSAVHVLGEVDRLLGDTSLATIIRDQDGREEPHPDSVLRHLHYPPDPQQTGARRHLDRSLVTCHCGDMGGQLLAHESEESDDGMPIEPAEGQMAVFWGVKVLWAANGKLSPLWHSSTCRPNENRRAMVAFLHGDVGHTVHDSKTVLGEWRRQRGG